MAQLRDIQTSQILHEGTPLECVAIALQLGVENILFDDVGLDFNHDAVWQATQEQQAALASVAQSDSEDQDLKSEAQASLDELKKTIADAEAQAQDVASRQAAIQAGDQESPIA